MSGSGRSRGGFTLIEVMVALGVMVIVATLAWSTMSGTIALRDYLEQEDELARSARVAMTRVTRSLSLAFLTPNTSAVGTYMTVFVGRDEDDADQVWFATRAHRRTYRNARECDQAEVTFFTGDDPEHQGRMALYVRESPRIDQYPDKDGPVMPIATSVSRFDLRYLDPETAEWRDEWDTTGVETPNRLPRAVQVVLTLMGPDPDDPEEEIERPFVETVILETAKVMQKSALSSGQKGMGATGSGQSMPGGIGL